MMAWRKITGAGHTFTWGPRWPAWGTQQCGRRHSRGLDARRRAEGRRPGGRRGRAGKAVRKDEESARERGPGGAVERIGSRKRRTDHLFQGRRAAGGDSAGQHKRSSPAVARTWAGG